jgi:hypothetical protein
MATITGMKTGGYYDAHSGAQRAAIDPFLPWLEQAIERSMGSLEIGTPCTILDIGSSEGGNAVYAMKRLVSSVRGVSDSPVWVFLSDLPTNDFNQLFANLFPRGDAALSGERVFTGAIGGSAFNRLAPARSLRVVTTFNALGYLSAMPADRLPNFILPMKPSPLAAREGVGLSDSEQEPFRLQAANDLHQFYSARAEEIVSGGKLLVQMFGRNSEISTSHGTYDALSDAILDCVTEGSLSREFYESVLCPIYFRSIEELIAPVEQDSELSNAFRIDKSDHCEIPVPFNTALAETGDRATWARDYTGFMRAFTEPSVADALGDEPEKEKILDAIYQRVEARFLAEPDRYEFHYISIGALLTRL